MAFKSKNIVYKSVSIARLFHEKRSRWDGFFPSERWIFERIGEERKGFGRVLDVGCAAGGLGLALSERYPVRSYSGVDVNEEAIRIARNTVYKMPVRFRLRDILKVEKLENEPFDTVFSLSCADWNIEAESIINSCWKRLTPGGEFIISLRLTNKKGVNDIKKSFQYICYEGKGDRSCEKANYVVFNIFDALGMFAHLKPAPRRIIGYGYWGKPSTSARTPYSELAFTVFAVEKGKQGGKQDILTELHLPLGLIGKGADRR